MESCLLKIVLAGLRQERSRLTKPLEFPEDGTAMTRRNLGDVVHSVLKSISRDSAPGSNS